MLMTAVFLDANVFFYAAGAEHPLREPAQQVIQKVAAGELVATTSTEILQEILFVMQRRGQADLGLQLVRNTVSLFPDLLSVTRNDMLIACDLLERYPRIRTRDAVHAATMLNNGLDSIVSADGHFDEIEGIRRIPMAS
ncbi:MAG TPA: type II toxin-antitoxin system VapC family toxin [Thermoanaerobaculia bacterium]|nr:type II toxin-antitoxin system VapC family toxin [Thermoanaerobaculia bacterium]